MKNTAGQRDAALSAEHMLINLDVKNSYREWMRNICKAQADDGSLPGIIPTGGWGLSGVTVLRGSVFWLTALLCICLLR